MMVRNLRNWAFIGPRDSKGGPSFYHPSGCRVSVGLGKAAVRVQCAKVLWDPQWDGSVNGAANGKQGLQQGESSP